MRFGREDVRRIAALARLDLPDVELDRFAAQLASVLDHVAALEDAGTAAGEAEPAPLRREPRADVIDPDPLTVPLSELAPGFADGFFTVPRLRAFDTDRSGPEPGE